MPDPEVARKWLIAVVAERFHVLPSLVARDLDEDPEMLSLECFRLLGYGDAKSAYDSAEGDWERLKPWRGSDVMKQVEQNDFNIRHERMHPESVDGCAMCVKRIT